MPWHDVLWHDDDDDDGDDDNISSWRRRRQLVSAEAARMKYVRLRCWRSSRNDASMRYADRGYADDLEARFAIIPRGRPDPNARRLCRTTYADSLQTSVISAANMVSSDRSIDTIEDHPVAEAAHRLP